MSPISFDVKILDDCAHANQHSESCDQPPEVEKRLKSFQLLFSVLKPSLETGRNATLQKSKSSKLDVQLG